MPSVDEMMQDLQTADAAGDTELAQHIAGQIKAVQNTATAAAAGPALSDAAQQAVPPDHGLLDTLSAGVRAASHQVPLIGDTAMTLGAMGSDALHGNPVDYARANSEVQGLLAQDAANHPIVTAVGGVAGAGLTAAAGGAALKAAGVAAPAALALRPGAGAAGLAANAGRLALAGAAGGALQGGAQAGGEQIAAGNLAAAPWATAKGALGGAAAGAVVGPIAGGAAAGVKKAFLPLAGKTAQALAKVFGESPADLQAAWSTFTANTGRAPTMAELATLKQRGEITAAARDSTAISTTLSQAQEDAARARSDTMQQTLSPQAQSSGQQANVKTAQGDLDYAAARQHNFSVSTAEDATLGGVSPADHLAAQIVPLAGLKTADRVRIVAGLQNGDLSGQDAQMIRSKLNAAQGVGSSYSPAVASAIGDLDDILKAPANAAASGALDTATSNYVANAQREAGAQHGESVLGAQTAPNFAAEAAAKPNANDNFAAGLPAGARSKLADAAATPAGATSLAGRLATDDSLHAKLTTALGPQAADALRRMGQSETGAAQNLAPFGNRTPGTDDQDGKDLNTGLRALATFASHGVYQFYHGAKALAGLGMSPQVQNTVARYLADPNMTRQGIKLLQKAGADNAMLRRLALSAAQSAGLLGGSASAAVQDDHGGVTIEDVHPATAAEIAAATARQ